MRLSGRPTRQWPGSIILRLESGGLTQRHVPIELGVPGLTHLPHAAFADLGGDDIRAESGAG